MNNEEQLIASSHQYNVKKECPMPSPRELFKLAYEADRNRKFDEAENFYRQALKLNPKYSMAWNNLGWILFDQFQQYKEAEKCYKKALKYDNRNFYAWNNWGILYYRQKMNFSKAQECWEKAITFNPEFGNAWNNLSVLYKFQHGNPTKAREFEEKAIKYQNSEQKQTPTSNLTYNFCSECGSTLEASQKICDVCGLER
ncbi:Photosystem I assembly protein Ycf3 [Candidatus Lokiarchaeum ossiferum]|uniref:Photosystem I assembly protein Ycf3 n=1 Tax=Candidatus Lokiarchaeum ossiferum TaxID=2951803 RepID=A0ABY6HPY4_9ARCH|nr:Photosystem I assembly protein Ycf3 [Candidatus Lokiarchaeum sp. B-35]